MHRAAPLAVAVVVAVLALVALAATAVARTVDVPTRLAAAIPKAHDSDVPVLLPATMNLDYDKSGKLYAGGSGSKRKGSYVLSLGGAKGCSAGACFLASFTGEQGQPLGFKATISLALGMKGAYNPLSCGASCSPPSIQWVQKGVRYEIQAKALGGRKAFISMANSAILAGNRK
jgi:hypothetical protein